MPRKRAGCAGILLVEVNFGLVDITPAPVLAWFDRLHDGVADGVKVFRRVLVLR
jgi:hypothetical protein